MTRVYLALGSNVGDSSGHVKQAVDLLRPLLGELKLAPLYHSKAVSYTDQPDFVNTAISGTTDLKPLKLLKSLKDIEQRVGRTATFHHGPREIDIDIIFYGDQILKSRQLTIPHPEFARRDFVLKPLLDLDPELIDPATGQTVKQLLGLLKPGELSIRGKVDD